MAVMTSQGFVGRVTKVNKFSSQVDLISTNTRAGKLSVNIQHGSKNIFGLIDRYDEKNSELVISDINNRDNISKGDKVVTSGLADQLPSNLYIGEVTKVQNDQYGLAKEVRVKTGADLTDLSHVYVAKEILKQFLMMKAGINNAYTVLFLIGILLFYIDTAIGLLIPMHIGKFELVFVPHLTFMYILMMVVYRGFGVSLLLSIFLGVMTDVYFGSIYGVYLFGYILF